MRRRCLWLLSGMVLITVWMAGSGVGQFVTSPTFGYTAMGASNAQGAPAPIYLPRLAREWDADAMPTPVVTPTVSPSPASTPTPTPLPGGQPDPYFPQQGDDQWTFYDKYGNITEIRVGKWVSNRGQLGQVFASINWVEQSETATVAFSLGAGQSALVTAHFYPSCGSCGYYQWKFEWTTRAAQTGDVPSGEVEVLASTLREVTLYPGAFDDVAVVAKSAYVLQGGHLCQLDVTSASGIKPDPGCLRLSESYPSSQYRIAVAGGYAYVTIGDAEAHGQNGLYLIDLSSGKRLAGRYLTGDAQKPIDLAVSGAYAYVVSDVLQDSSDRLLIIDVSNPGNPRQVGSYTAAGATGVAVKDANAYLVGGGRLDMIGIGNPTSPTLGDRYFYPSSSLGGTYRKDRVAVSGDYAYVSNASCNLSVLDLRVPSASRPVPLGQWPPGYDCSGTDLAVGGNYAYLSVGGGIEVIDASIPYAPNWLGRYVGLGVGGRGVALDDQYAYLAASDGLHILPR